jgi:hypothetical protein
MHVDKGARDHVDPEYQRWKRKYPRFPGVAELMRLIRTRKAKGSWADIIVNEMADHAKECMADLLETFRTDESEEVRLYIMMALDIARPPEAVPFLAEVLREGNPRYARYAESALRGINTREARTALWNITNS